MKPVVVVKLGGAAMASGASLDGFARDLAHLAERGWWPVVVHGGGPALTAMLARLGVENRFVDGHRATSREAADVAVMVLSGQINKDVVGALVRAGAPAVGLSGADAGLLEVSKYQPLGRDLGFVGQVDRVDPTLLHVLLDHGYLPVLSTTAGGADGRPYNVNADVVAGAVAVALGAERLVFLSDVEGVRVAGRFVSELDLGETRELLDGQGATDGMRPKLEAALAALEGGVASVQLVDGRVSGAVVDALIAGPGIGTTITAAAVPAVAAETRSHA